MSIRHEIDSKLKGETLVRRGLLQTYEGRRPERIAPDLSVVKIGGHGIIDYGAPVVLPLLEEIGDLSRENHFLAVTGGGVRVRHIMDIGLDLGMPTGVLAELASRISEQNAIMVSVLLSRYNGVRIPISDLLEVPTLLKIGLLPVTHGTPPYGLYEHPPEIGMIPSHRTDTGAFLIAEVLGAKNCILLKNTDGLYTEDPFKNPEAELIKDISAQELIEMNMDDLVLERKVVELLINAKSVHEVKIVNGHVKGNLTRALYGELIGTTIRSER